MTTINHNTLTLNGVEYVRADSVPAAVAIGPVGPKAGTVADPYGTVKCMPIATIAVRKGW
jgi:hypothetical protein